MTQDWQPGVQYNYGDVVVFQGAEYQIIQPHRSQGDWTPPATPALWGPCQGQGGCNNNNNNNYSCQEKCQTDYNQACGQQQQQSPQAQYQQGNQQGNQQGQQGGQPAGAQQQQQQHGWFDEHKKELEIGGGILAGAAALTAGFAAFKHHATKQEDERAQAWSADNWMREAQARAAQWRAGQLNAPVAWIWNEGKNIPRDAIQGGEERGQAIYICRVYHEGGLMIGKASGHLKHGASIGFKKDEIEVDKYEILVGNSRAVRWVPTSGQLNVARLRAQPLEGGREPNGTLIYIAQAPHRNAVYPGKACEIYEDGCFIALDGTEKKVKEYAILCQA